MNIFATAMTQPKILLNEKQLELTINRLCFQLIENHNDFAHTVLVGLQPRGSFLSEIIVKRLNEIKPELNIRHGLLDVSFYRDDFRRRDTPISVSSTTLNEVIEGQKVVLIDDVLYTGRTIRSGLDALMDFGRPESVEFLVMIDRRFSRQLPIQADYIGRTVDAVASERIDVKWSGDSGIVYLNTLSTDE